MCGVGIGGFKVIKQTKSGWGHAQKWQKKEDYNSRDFENGRSDSRRGKNDLAMLAQKHADSNNELMTKK